MKQIISFILIFWITNSYSQIPNEISKADKIYGLSKFWQEVNYNFIYLNKVDKKEWEKRYKALILEVEETKNDYEYYRLLQKFCAFLKDGHTNVYFPKKIRDNIYTTNFGEYRIFISNIQGKAIITRVNLSKKDVLPIGTEIIKVNGMETKNYLKQYVSPYISSSTDYILEDLAIKNLLKGYIGTSYNLELKFPNGTIKKLTVTHKKTEENEVFPALEKRKLLDFKWINNEIAYVSLNSFSDWKISILFNEKIPELQKAKKLIIDLRYNSGGNTNIGKQIFTHLTKDVILYGSKTQSRLHIPTYKAWGRWTKATDTTNNPSAKQSYLSYRDMYYYDFPYTPEKLSSEDRKLLKKERIVVPTVLLIGHNTASAAEDFLIYADNQKHMIKIGEPTFASTGQPILFALPNEGVARVCTKKDMYPNGKEFVGVGIQPDIKVIKTLSDYLENKDPALKRAIEYLTLKTTE